MNETKSQSPPKSLTEELWEIPTACRQVWDQLPDKALFLIWCVAWIALFHFFGNSTLGYVNTPSLFGWLRYVYRMSDGDSHGLYMPVVVLGLAYWKRGEILAAPRSRWWPAVLLVALGLLIHIAGYVIQQTRVSIVGFFLGLYGLMGMVWGWRWLLATFFPFCLFAFCVPLATETDRITLPLRLMATAITSTFCHTVLGIDLVRQGTMITDAKGQYQYEIAAACSGIKSLSATVAIAIIGGFVTFKAPWRRLLMFVAAFPLAVLGNVLRLTTIIVASEAFGQSAGNYVHDNSILNLLPYVPAIGGVALLMRYLGEDAPVSPTTAEAKAEAPTSPSDSSPTV